VKCVEVITNVDVKNSIDFEEYRAKVPALARKMVGNTWFAAEKVD
jgi:hypothetical protein